MLVFRARGIIVLSAIGRVFWLKNTNGSVSIHGSKYPSKHKNANFGSVKY